MSNQKQIIAFLFIVGLLIGCVSGVPTESDARVEFEKRFEKEIKDGAIRITEFKKTDGQSGELMGVKFYSLKYEAEIEYLKEENCRAISNLCGWGSRAKSTGEKEIRKGEINYEKTENGWQVRKGL